MEEEKGRHFPAGDSGQVCATGERAGGHPVATAWLECAKMFKEPSSSPTS